MYFFSKMVKTSRRDLGWRGLQPDFWPDWGSRRWPVFPVRAGDSWFSPMTLWPSIEPFFGCPAASILQWCVVCGHMLNLRTLSVVTLLNASCPPWSPWAPWENTVLSLWGWVPRIDPLRWGVFGIPTIPTCVYAERDICLTSLPNIVFPVLFGDRMMVAAFFMRSPASWSAHAWSTFLVQYSNHYVDLQTSGPRSPPSGGTAGGSKRDGKGSQDTVCGCRGVFLGRLLCAAVLCCRCCVDRCESGGPLFCLWMPPWCPTSIQLLLCCVLSPDLKALFCTALVKMQKTGSLVYFPSFQMSDRVLPCGPAQQFAWSTRCTSMGGVGVVNRRELSVISTSSCSTLMPMIWQFWGRCLNRWF